MTRKYLFLALLFLFQTAVYGQKLQFGIGASINGTIFHKGKSTYDDYFFETKIKTGFGLSIPCYIKLSDHWSLRTGIGFQNKKYHFEQNKYDFPDVIEKSGSFYFRLRFITTEVPVVICFSPADNEKKYKLEYKLGCILTYNVTREMTAGVNTFEYSGTDTCNYLFSGDPPNWTTFFSPDLYAGISLIRTKETLRRHELTLSYQYSFTPTTQYEFTSSLWTTSLTKEYRATLRPNLSYIALSYAFFPQW